MCAPTAISGVLGAFGDAQAASGRNKAKERAYQYKMKIREAKAMRQDVLYKNKKVSFTENVRRSKLAAARAYTRSQINLNNAVSNVMLQNQEKMQSLFEANADVASKAASRGVTGKSLARMMAVNKAKLGISQAQASRNLVLASYRLKQDNYTTSLKLKDTLNKEFSKVVLNPVRDIPEPPPVLENPGSIFMLGAAGAIASGIGEGEFKSPDYQAKDLGGGKSSSISFADSYNMDFGDTNFTQGFDYQPMSGINWSM